MANKNAREPKEKKTVRMSVTVAEGDYRDIESIAQRKKVSVAWVIREAVERYLAREFPLFRETES